MGFRAGEIVTLAPDCGDSNRQWYSEHGVDGPFRVSGPFRDPAGNIINGAVFLANMDGSPIMFSHEHQLGALGRDICSHRFLNAVDTAIKEEKENNE